MLADAAHFFTGGGLFMWPILAALACALAIILERALFFARIGREEPDALVAEVARSLTGEGTPGTRPLLGGRSPLQRVLAAALQRHQAGLPAEALRQGVEEAAVREIPRLGRRIGYLALLANVSTLTGLLGTIFGLQQSFASLAMTEAAQKAAALAAGISVALNTTAFGLIVAIPCMIAYAVLSSAQTPRTEEIDAASLALLDCLDAHRGAVRAVGSAPDNGPATTTGWTDAGQRLAARLQAQSS